MRARRHRTTTGQSEVENICAVKLMWITVCFVCWFVPATCGETKAAAVALGECHFESCCFIMTQEQTFTYIVL